MKSAMRNWWTQRGGRLAGRLVVGATLFQATGIGGCSDEQFRELAAGLTAGVVRAVANQFISDAIQEFFGAGGF